MKARKAKDRDAAPGRGRARARDRRGTGGAAERGVVGVVEWPLIEMEHLVRIRNGTTDPSRYPVETFELYSIPGFDASGPEMLLGSEIKSNKTNIRPGDLLFSKLNPRIPRVWIVPEKAQFRQISSTEFWPLMCDATTLDPHYLRHYLLTPSMTDRLSPNTEAATKSRSRIKPFQLLGERIPLSEQRRIVEILDQADRLRRLRAEADAKAERILPALFIKMFGDPATNPMGWPRVRLGELLTAIDSGWSPLCEDRQAIHSEWGVLKLGAVTSNRYLENEQKALPNDLEPRPKLEVQSGDLLFSRKNTRKLVGACAYVEQTRPRLLLSDLIFRLRLRSDDEMHPVYLWALLTCPSKRPSIEMLASGSAGSMPNISKARLETLEIERPHYSLQVRFAEVANRVNSLRSCAVLARAKVEWLFSLLMNRAFTGDLTASWRQAHMKELLHEMEQQAKALQKETH